MKLYLTARATDITSVEATAILTAVQTAGLECLELTINNSGLEVLRVV